MPYPNTDTRQPARSNQLATTAVNLAGKNLQLTYWLAGNVVAAALAILPLPHAGHAATALATGVNVGFASSLLSKKRLAEAESAEKRDRTAFERDMRKLESTKTEVEKLQRENAANDSRLIAFQAQLKTKESTMRDRLHIEAHKAAQKAAQVKLDEMQAKLDKALGDKAAMQATYQEKSTQMAKQTTQIVGKVSKAHKDLGDNAAKAISTGNEVLAKERQQVNHVLESLGRDIKAMAADLAKQKELVAKLQGPKFHDVQTFEHQTANKIMHALRQGENAISLSKGAVQLAKYGESVMCFEPLGEMTIDQVNAKLEKVAPLLGLREIPKASYNGDGFIAMRVRLSGEQKPKADVIRRISVKKIQAAFLDVPFGLRANGMTGRGKSTLIRNLIHLYQQDMGQLFTIFDPKTDFPTAEFSANTVYRTPGRCIENIGLIGDVCTARQDYKMLNDEQGVTIPAQHQVPRLFLIDETKDIHDAAVFADGNLPAKERHYVREFKLSIQKGLEVGRGLKVRVIYSTVTPDSSDFGFNNSVFKQSASVFMGDSIADALRSNGKYLTSLSPEKTAMLRTEYDARVASTDSRDDYQALFFNGLTGECFLFSPPAPDAWKTEKVKPVLEGGSPALAKTPENPATQSQQQAQPSPKVAQNETGLGSASKRRADSPMPSLREATKECLISTGVLCPDCEAVATGFKSRTVRKSDSTVRVRCNTKGCESGGEFRAKVTG